MSRGEDMSATGVSPLLASEPGVQADARAVQRGWLRIGIGLAVAAQAMVFSLAVNITPAEGAAYWVVHGGLIASAAGVLVFLGRDLVGEAWAAARARRVSIDLLFLTTLLGALGGSLTSTFTGTGSVYYEVVAVLVVVHTLGKMAGARSRSSALRAADAVAEKYDRCVVLADGGREETRTVAELRGGERVVVAPGGAICVDGVIAEGRSYVEEAALTGEWRPVARGPGERVWAGTHAVDGRLVVVAEAGERRLDGVLRAVAEARLAPSRLQAQADRLMAWWLPVVTGVAAATFFGWWLGAGAEWTRALFNAMAVLLVACPCAMGLATPVAVWGGLARLAKLGIVARSGDFLDALARVDTVCFDKTGTLSEERLTVLGWEIEPAWRGREAELKAMVAAVERGLAHPVARALAETSAERLPAKCNQFGYTLPELRVVAGAGVEAFVEGWGVMRVGERSFCGGGGDMRAEAGKLVWVSVEGEVAARVRLGETWREGVEETVAGLRALGVEPEVLTGDPAAVEIGQCNQFGYTLPVRAGMTPGEKLARVRELGAEGRRVLFAGDGVNDAAAMGAAAASLALRGGSELARAAAMAVCAGDDLRRLPEAVRVARRVRAGVRGNLRFAATYNAVGMALAAAGTLHPVAAALLMVGSSVWVGVRAVRSAETAA
jgi:heavy metal translocating P-type ATPase